MNNKEKLKRIFEKVIAVDESKITDNFSMEENSEWDSFNHLLLINEIEREFNIEIKASEINSIKDFDNLKTIVENYISKEQ